MVRPRIFIDEEDRFHFHVYLHKEQYETVVVLARIWGCSKSEVIRRLIGKDKSNGEVINPPPEEPQSLRGQAGIQPMADEDGLCPAALDGRAA